MTAKLPVIATDLSQLSLDAYIQRVNQTPILTANREKELAEAWYYKQNVEAARELVMSHLRFVVKIARNFRGYGLPLGDLIQEGNIGLMKAVKRFNPELGVRLVSFAVHWVKSEMHEYIIKNWRVVKIATTKAQRKLFFNLRKMSNRLGWNSKEEVAEVAKVLNVSTKDVEEMEMRLNGMDVAFDGDPVDDASEHAYVAPAHYLTDSSQDPALLIEKQTSADNSQESLFSALSKLDERSQDILKRRWLAERKETLQVLSAEYGVSAERIRQLEKNAMKKLKDAMS